MPRSMRRLDTEFRREVSRALDLVQAVERARVYASSALLHYTRVEYVYEVAFLRIFVAWEAFLEASFLRYLCGHASRHGQATLTQGNTYAPTIQAAEGRLLGTRDWVLWHDPSKVVSRCQGFVVNGAHEQVIASAGAQLEQIAAVRHRIAHSNPHARQQFDRATGVLAGRRYRGSRAGAFLRAWDYAASPKVRWMHTLAADLVSLASQIV